MYKKYIAIIFIAFIGATANAEELQIGKWSGVYTSYHGSSLNAEYHVSKDEEADSESVQIKMILDLQPRAEYTYELQNIKLIDKKLSFDIKKSNETKNCELEQLDNEQYVGLCKSSNDPDPEGKWLSSILMTPPE